MAKMKCFDYFSNISIYYGPTIAELANDSKRVDIAEEMKKQFNGMRIISKKII